MSSKVFFYLLQAECCWGEGGASLGAGPKLHPDSDNHPGPLHSTWELSRWKWLWKTHLPPHPPHSSTARYVHRTCIRSCLFGWGGGQGGSLPQNLFWKKKGKIFSPSRRVSIEGFNKCGQAKGNTTLCWGKQLSELTIITAQNKQGKEGKLFVPSPYSPPPKDRCESHSFNLLELVNK